jgi:hypothetical protein
LDFVHEFLNLNRSNDLGDLPLDKYGFPLIDQGAELF